MQSTEAIKAIAVLEAFKGLVVLMAGSGALLLIHRDLQEIAMKLVEHAHLNPASKYPSIFIEAAANTQNTRLLLLAAGAAAYSLLRFVEAYGLWHDAVWAQLLAAVSGALYIPFEIGHLVHRTDGLSLAILLINVGVVVVMIGALRSRQAGGRARTG
jgi:uncharacterized membrane protein (DUF2068 family)